MLREGPVLDAWYLIDALIEGSLIKLRLFDPESDQLKEVKDSNYKPYFIIPFPPSPADQENLRSLPGEFEVVNKIDLYTHELRQLGKVSVYKPAFIKKTMKKFVSIWESEIEFNHSYVYDHGLIFGAQHAVQAQDHFIPILTIPDNLRAKFDTTFSYIMDVDPLKYAQIERWFNLLHQPVPPVKAGILGISGEVNPEKYFAAFMLSRLANLPVSFTYTSRSVSDWLKSMMYDYLRRNNILVPTSKELRRGLETHMVPGALTITPKSGVYFNTVVTDFESLYPSCIDSYNLSYETVDCGHEECKANMISDVGHYVCTKRRGFLAALVGALKDLRIRWFKPRSKDNSLSESERRQAEITAGLLKLLTVSSYGVSVRIHGLACPPLAESITAYGRWALQTTWDIAEKNGLHPIYGDTDSVFLESASSDKVDWLIRAIKQQLHLDLAVERQYSVCVLSKAKKAYFGILSDGTPDLKGLTAIKSNAPNFVQNVFKKCVKELNHVKNASEYDLAKAKITTIVQDAIQELQDGKIELKDLIFSIKLYHDPKEKMAANVLPQPYQCAAQLIASGTNVKQGDTVSFIKVRPFNYRGRQFTVKPANSVNSVSEINVEDYVRNLTTALNQTFKPMGITFERKKETRITEWLEKQD
jgi:DNA polymerase elongation subunit (family B)